MRSSGTRPATAAIIACALPGVPVPMVSPSEISQQPMSSSRPATSATASGAMSPS